LRAIVDTPLGKNAAAKLARDTLAEREAAALALAELEKQGPTAGVDRDLLQEKLVAARAVVRQIELELSNAVGAGIGASFAFEARRNDLQEKLRSTASPLIAAFIAEMWQEMEA